MKFNWKYFNFAAWITIILTFVLPYRENDGFATSFGYPIPFFTVYNKPIGSSIIMSTGTNIGGFLVNVLIIYLLIYLICYLKQKYIIKQQ